MPSVSRPAYRLTVTRSAQRDIDGLFERLARYDQATAISYEFDLRESIANNVLTAPYTWAYFHLTGRPTRAYLYTISRRTSYWVVYEIDEPEQIVRVLRVWNAARDPGEFEKY